MLNLLEHATTCVTVLVVAFMVALSLPQSRLRGFVLEIAGWLLTALCAAYVISPLDLVPDFIPIAGWIDDAGALGGGAVALLTALRARRDRHNLLEEGKPHEQFWK